MAAFCLRIFYAGASYNLVAMGSRTTSFAVYTDQIEIGALATQL